MRMIKNTILAKDVLNVGNYYKLHKKSNGLPSEVGYILTKNLKKRKNEENKQPKKE